MGRLGGNRLRPSPRRAAPGCSGPTGRTAPGAGRRRANGRGADDLGRVVASAAPDRAGSSACSAWRRPTARKAGVRRPARPGARTGRRTTGLGRLGRPAGAGRPGSGMPSRARRAGPGAGASPAAPSAGRRRAGRGRRARPAPTRRRTHLGRTGRRQRPGGGRRRARAAPTPRARAAGRRAGQRATSTVPACDGPVVDRRPRLLRRRRASATTSSTSRATPDVVGVGLVDDEGEVAVRPAHQVEDGVEDVLGGRPRARPSSIAPESRARGRHRGRRRRRPRSTAALSWSSTTPAADQPAAQRLPGQVGAPPVSDPSPQAHDAVRVGTAQGAARRSSS